ncbi:hypothetical protein ABZ370_12045 [Streptomyces sp. NPDC005962]
MAYYRCGPDEVWAFGARTGWMSNFRNEALAADRVRIARFDLSAEA